MITTNFRAMDSVFVEKHFPKEECVIKSTKEKGIYESDKTYLCLIIDKRFRDYRQIKLMKPYLWIGDETEDENFKGQIGFGWLCLSENNNPYDNWENPITIWDEFVIGWLPYEEDNDEEYLSNLVSQFEV
jgi:hypothetical protein